MELNLDARLKWPGAKREAEGVSASLREKRGKREGPRRRSPKVQSAAQPRGGGIRFALALVFGFGLALTSAPAMGQINGGAWELLNGRLQKRVNGILSFMQYTFFPDVTTSSLSITNSASGNPNLLMGQLGGGFTWSRSSPLYLEGNAAYSRFDPTFIATNGTETREVPVKWTTLTGTVGVGWDFRLAPELVLRPIANFTIGHLETDLSALARIIEIKTGTEIEFLKNGNLNSVGYGGSLMLDYEHYRRDYEIDVELRYTVIQLLSIPGTFEAVRGHTWRRTSICGPAGGLRRGGRRSNVPSGMCSSLLTRSISRIRTTAWISITSLLSAAVWRAAIPAPTRDSSAASAA